MPSGLRAITALLVLQEKAIKPLQPHASPAELATDTLGQSRPGLLSAHPDLVRGSYLGACLPTERLMRTPQVVSVEEFSAAALLLKSIGRS
jgi:hypothetical protein